MKAPERIIEAAQREYATLNFIINSHQKEISDFEAKLDLLKGELKSLKREEAEIYRFLTANHVEVERGCEIDFSPLNKLGRSND